MAYSAGGVGAMLVFQRPLPPEEEANTEEEANKSSANVPNITQINPWMGQGGTST